jgi:hypothetical protein
MNELMFEFSYHEGGPDKTDKLTYVKFYTDSTVEWISPHHGPTPRIEIRHWSLDNEGIMHINTSKSTSKSTRLDAVTRTRSIWQPELVTNLYLALDDYMDKSIGL